MNYLAIDTSTRSTVLGVLTDNLITDRSTGEVRTHSREILPSINALLEETGLSLQDLDAIIFGQGPGSFTGLRIAAGVVQGLAYGLRIPVVPISSMQCLAQSVPAENGDLIFVALEARLEEIYFGSYQFVDGLAVPLEAEGVVDVSDLRPLTAGLWKGIGDAWRFRDRIEASTGVRFEGVIEHAIPAVTDLLHLGENAHRQGQTVNALETSPVYLREEVASRPGKR